MLVNLFIRALAQGNLVFISTPNKHTKNPLLSLWSNSKFHFTIGVGHSHRGIVTVTKLKSEVLFDIRRLPRVESRAKS